MEPFPSIYLNGDTVEQFVDRCIPEGLDDVFKFHSETKAAEFADCVAAASNTKAMRSWPAPLSDGIVDPKVLAADYRKWFQKSACELRRFAHLGSFSWYLNGFYAAVADSHQKVAFLGTPGNKIFRLDTGGFISADSMGPAAVARFPDCSNKLDDFDVKIDGWMTRIRRLNKADAEQGSEPRDKEIMACCLEAAQEAATALEESNVTNANNPLVIKLVDLAFAMIERLMVLYDKDEHDKNRYQWTEFAKMLISESTKGSSLEQARFCRGQLVGTPDVMKLQRPQQIADLAAAISSAKTILETDAGTNTDGRRVIGEFSKLAEELEEEVCHLQSVKLSVMQSMKRFVECKVFVGSVVHSELNTVPLIEKITEQFPKLQVEESKGSWDRVFNAMEREQAPIAFIVRRVSCQLNLRTMSCVPEQDACAPYLGVLKVSNDDLQL